MRQKVSTLLLVGLLIAAPAAADTTRDAPHAPAPRMSATTKRVVWTIVGAGAGFAAGVFLGLQKFDDALYSDRKVWTTAIVGAAAGGVAGALLSRNVGRGAPTTRAIRSTDVPDVTWTEALRGASGVTPPRAGKPAH